MSQFPPDYHMHTPLCRHAVGEPVELAAHAVKVGLQEIGFSDHAPMPQDNFDEWRMNDSQLAEYVEKVERARQEFPNLKIKLALEVDFIPGYETWIEKLAARYPWDYFIGSVHYISDSWAIDNPSAMSEWRDRAPYDVWRAYFDRLALAAESKLFDVIAHPDLCKKFSIYPTQDCTPLFTRFLDAASKSGVAVELNTAGLRKDCREIYPSASFLKLAAERKLPISFGSDAHAPGEVGADFPAAISLARSMGYTHSQQFTRRRAESVPF